MLITGADATVLLLHEELRSWSQRGVTFTLATDGGISIEAAPSVDESVHREARAYRAKHGEELRRYLAFVEGRDPDDAVRHLEFAWSARQVCAHNEQGVAMADEWRPVWVQRIDREIAGYEKERDKHRTMFDEYTRKLEELKDKRKSWTDGKNADGN